MDKCPLKELPEKMKYCNGTYNGQVKGWNDCIDKILNRQNARFMAERRYGE